MSTFNLLHSKVQKFIYKQKWESFRPIQDDAIAFIKNETGHLLICAPTASGKTEAAFLPIVSEIADDFSDSFKVLYISPLKALINDQFRRIDEICEDIGIPVTKWHGDVGQNLKKKSLENPKGILLITPESIEAMLIRKPQLLKTAFCGLKYIVIDEIHSFIGTERGAQLYSIINRLKISSMCRPRIVALSATIGNPENVAEWISGNDSFKIIEDSDWTDDSGIEGIIKGFEVDDNPDSDEEQKTLLTNDLINSLYLDFLSGKNLVFGNSKKKLEETAYKVSNLAKERNSRTEFLIHHGSLSKTTRELAEKELKEATYPTTIFCTSTLEMGIDVGKIEKIGLIDPPWTVSGFAQRVGRSGRRAGSSKKFEFLIQQNTLHEESNLSEMLREDLVKAIAIVNLYLDGFKEPLVSNGYHLSTLVHQVLSYCVQKSGCTYQELVSVILEGSFRSIIEETDFKNLIEHLIQVEILFQEKSGDILAGKIGERLADHYEFYAVFQSSENWKIVCDGQLIGEIPVIGSYCQNDHLLLAGRVWSVVEVNESSKRITVIPAKNAKAPLFNSSFGITHKKIHDEMKRVYENPDEITFANDKGIELLNQGKENYRTIVMAENYLVTPIFEGTILQNTISSALKMLNIEHGITECILQIEDADLLWLKKLDGFLNQFQTNLQLAEQIPSIRKHFQKYDEFLPESLLNKSYANNYLNLSGAKQWIANAIRSRK